ncbi:MULTISPECIES: hypothetical protein [unclassified Rhodococcus (in: high G+C Gram-positive bacteria)]|uniref:hypothetical protein n=1 Tax=unclassified Rhodococcus (in: high G+C Gram-positive bacteria) TaxID=192944 RepID=UPI0006FE79DE|nr:MULTISPECIES: hypothetical protein [unclassified Rhodococcus (in: high G+C Gram-positive bacteria)]KQU30312.1 hypothetical protein ASG69_04440 [Rhodococcus sp. Leaf225]KQU44783.1 hypothetical protein ASH03_12700 [Rhodococcus sp. Leaf258]
MIVNDLLVDGTPAVTMTKTVHNPHDQNDSIWSVALVDGTHKLLTGHEIADLARKRQPQQWLPDELWHGGSGDDLEWSNVGRSDRWGPIPAVLCCIGIVAAGAYVIGRWLGVW